MGKELAQGHTAMDVHLGFVSSQTQAQGSGSQRGVILFPRGHSAMSGEIFGCHNWGKGVLLGIVWVAASDAAKHPTMHRTAPHNQALSSPECQ